MRYFVVAPDGRQYGPADAIALRGWLQEGRVAPETPLIEEGSGRHIMVRDLLGLGGGEFAPPYAPRPGEFAAPFRKFDDGSGDLRAAWVCIGLSLLVCELLPFVGMFYALRAYSKGKKAGMVAFFCALVALVISILSTVWVVQQLPQWMGAGQQVQMPDSSGGSSSGSPDLPSGF